MAETRRDFKLTSLSQIKIAYRNYNLSIRQTWRMLNSHLSGKAEIIREIIMMVEETYLIGRILQFFRLQ